MVEFDKDVTTVTTKFVVTTVTTKFVVTVVTTDGLLHPSSDCYIQVRRNKLGLSCAKLRVSLDPKRF